MAGAAMRRVPTSAEELCGWGVGRALTQRELDEECEAHLQQRYGESLDFAIENSLPFLLRDGLITRNARARPY